MAPDVPAPPGRTRFFLGLFAAGLVVPLADVPGWGISLSTPLFCFLALDLALGREPLDWRPYRKWILLALLFWTGQFLSIAGNFFAGRLTEFSVNERVHLLRLAYWMSVFVVTVAVVSRWRLGPWLCSHLAVSLIALAALRLAEALSLGAWGSATALFYTPNGYGFLFSVFTPFLLWRVLVGKGVRRLLCGLGLGLAVLALAGNGSRSSWAAVALGALVTGVLFQLTQPHSVARTFPLAAVGLATVLLAASAVPQSIFQPVRERFSSLDRLDQDKSLATRLVLLKKASQLFSENPWLGVGSGRFRAAHASLQIPDLLHTHNERDLNRRSAHNAYAGLLAESGIVGALPWAALLLVLAGQGGLAVWRVARTGATWLIPAYAAFAGMSLHLAALAGITGAAPWFLYGLVAAGIQHESS